MRTMTYGLLYLAVVIWHHSQVSVRRIIWQQVDTSWHVAVSVEQVITEELHEGDRVTNDFSLNVEAVLGWQS